jgi:hypothetical protein
MSFADRCRTTANLSALLVVLSAFSGTSANAAISAQDLAAELRNRPIRIGPQPRTCPERGAFGFCFYDSGWRPVVDNPIFRPLRGSDAWPDVVPICTISNRAGATLAAYGEGVGPMIRISGRPVHFRPIAGGPSGRERFQAGEGRLSIVIGATVARGDENDARRAVMTFTDHRGQAHVASVRIDCAV